jgi:hypothetical protein
MLGSAVEPLVHSRSSGKRFVRAHRKAGLAKRIGWPQRQLSLKATIRYTHMQSKP